MNISNKIKFSAHRLFMPILGLVLFFQFVQSTFAATDSRKWIQRHSCDQGQTIIEELDYPSLWDNLRNRPRDRRFKVMTYRSDIASAAAGEYTFELTGFQVSSDWSTKPIHGASNSYNGIDTNLIASSRNHEAIVFDFRISETDAIICTDEVVESGCYAGDHCTYRCATEERIPGKILFETKINCEHSAMLSRGH